MLCAVERSSFQGNPRLVNEIPYLCVICSRRLCVNSGSALLREIASAPRTFRRKRRRVCGVRDGRSKSLRAILCVDVLCGCTAVLRRCDGEEERALPSLAALALRGLRHAAERPCPAVAFRVSPLVSQCWPVKFLEARVSLASVARAPRSRREFGRARPAPRPRRTAAKPSSPGVAEMQEMEQRRLLEEASAVVREQGSHMKRAIVGVYGAAVWSCCSCRVWLVSVSMQGDSLAAADCAGL